MKRLVTGTRGRLTLISTTILALALLIANAAVLTSLGYTQHTDTDAVLATQMSAVLSGVEDQNGSISAVGSEATLETPDGVAIDAIVLGPAGPLSASPGQSISIPTLLAIASEARRSGRAWADVTDGRGVPRRLIAQPLSGAPDAPVVVLSRAVGELNALLGRTALVLAAVSIALLAAGGALAYWLAGRALRPVRTIASLAQSLGEGDLHRRVDLAMPPDELGQLVDTFNAMLARLEGSFESLRRFTADASHELRAPLTLLRTELDVALAHDRTPAEYRQLLERLRAEADHLTRLTDQLLVLARADAGALIPAREPIDVVDALHEAAARWSATARAKDVRLDVDADGGTVIGDAALVRRVLDNLVENAIRYAPAGTAVDLTAERTRDGWSIAVRDLGPGVPEEFRPALFTRFARPDPARTRGDGGTGLGLALCQAIVMAHGGAIELVRTDTGALFRVSLPN